MANAFLTPTQVTRTAMARLSEKLTFTPYINHQYDESFAQKGAKIGSKLRVRRPHNFIARRGEVMAPNESQQQFEEITVANLIGVDFEFSTTDLTMSINDFQAEYLESCTDTIASTIESDALKMIFDVPNAVSNIGNAITSRDILNAGALMSENLAPQLGRRILFSHGGNVDAVEATKGLFNNTESIGAQYKSGQMKNALGFDFASSSLMPSYTSGTNVGTGLTTAMALTINEGKAINISANTANTLRDGDVITFSGTYALHPVTKAVTNRLKQFVVTADQVAGSATVNFAPAIFTSGQNQNVEATGIGNGSAIVKIGGASAILKPAIAFSRDAFTIVCADLEIDKSMEWAAREKYQGISMRLWRQGDIRNNKILARFDVLYGLLCLRPELACRMYNN